MAKRTVTYKGVEYDSLPEACFGAWCEEAKQLGLLETVILQHTYNMTPQYTYTEFKQLKTKVKYIERTLMKPATYTADFVLYSTVQLDGLHMDMVEPQLCDMVRPVYVIDVKGLSNNTNAKGLFSLKQKIMMYTNGVYVNKVIPSQFFMNNGWPEELPEECYMKDGGLYAWLRRDYDKSGKSIKETWNV